MKLLFLLVMFVVVTVLRASDSGLESFRVSSPKLDVERVSGGSSSDSGSDISIPGYLSSLAACSELSSVSPSFSCSDSDNEKCAISDNPLNMDKIALLVAQKMYGSTEFQKSVYDALDMNRQLSFDPSQGKTLGDMLAGWLERQMTLRIDVNAQTLRFERIAKEEEQQNLIVRQMNAEIVALREQLAEQLKLAGNICSTFKDIQSNQRSIMAQNSELVAKIISYQQSKS